MAAGSSEGVGGRKRSTASRDLASGMLNVWDGSGNPFICGSSGVWSEEARESEASVVQRQWRLRGLRQR